MCFDVNRNCDVRFLMYMVTAMSITYEYVFEVHIDCDVTDVHESTVNLCHRCPW